MDWIRISALTWTAWLALLGVGCAGNPRPSVQIGPAQPVSADMAQCAVDGAAGYRLRTPHYTLFSTIPDPDTVRLIGQLMEGALGAYESLAPDVPGNARPMECYLFLTRAQWAAFTRAHTGEDAPIYLGVNRGGYTVGDWFVAYWMGAAGTASVAAHEGWHQYVARHLRGRLPPFLEEGLACLFEQVEWVDGLPRWDLTRNTARLVSLRATVDADRLIPLDRLIRMHAGQVVGRPAAEIEAFYAQSWAFARFMNDADRGRYRPALHRMLADAARGRLFDDSSQQSARGPFWDPATARPMIEHYLGGDLPVIARAYEQYVRQISNVTHAPDD